MDVVALILSLLALLVAAWAAWQTHRQAESAKVMATNDSERRAEERAARVAEEARLRKANVDVRITPPVRNSQVRELLLSNGGPAAASGVTVSFVRPLSGDGGRDGAFDRIDGCRYDLLAGDTKKLVLTPDFDTASRFEVAVRWTDPSGPQERLRTISLAPW